MSATVTERRCRRCGILASEAARQGEPICCDRGLVAGHSYVDVPVPGSHDATGADPSSAASGTEPEPEGRRP